jgi:hypothetical protein
MKSDLLTFDEKSEMLVEIIDDLLFEGEYLLAALKKIALYYSMEVSELKDYLICTKYDSINPVVARMPSCDKLGNYEIKATRFTQLTMRAINEFIYKLMIRNPEMTLLQAALSFIYYFEANPPTASIINTVANAIQVGLKKKKYSYIYKESLLKESVDAAKFLAKLCYN